MTTLNIDLPDALKRFVEEEAAKRGHTSPSEYVEALIRAEQNRATEDEFERKVLERIDSGPATDMTDEDWRAIRREVKESLEQRNRQ